MQLFDPLDIIESEAEFEMITVIFDVEVTSIGHRGDDLRIPTVLVGRGVIFTPRHALVVVPVHLGLGME